ncbi:ASCH domain-containing protein [Halorhabdus rudnickae]|uniref:ASCH domain-containing protein n=1 Tax=Halorhabdus rudnickae TaxID=1775544 RepID=UPI00108404BD|nr:ASCH domain-containing protein [Halorhabdus rudnickae]
MAHKDVEDILPGGHLTEQALSGDVTQIHRGQAYAEEGDTFEIEDTTFEVTDVTHRMLGDLTDEDAQREGSPDLDHYRQRLQHAHDNFEWDDDSEVVRHRFEQV